MRTPELRANLHKMVERIQSEQLLLAIHNFLSAREGTEPGQLWASLTPEQKQEVLLSYEESEDEINLIPADRVLQKEK